MRRRELAYNKKQSEIRALVRSDATQKSINIGNQKKHIKGPDGYIPGRSYVNGDLNTAQELIDRYHGTGEPKWRDDLEWTKKEFLTDDKSIGVVVDPETGAETETKRFLIQYGKNGTYVVPAREVGGS